MSVKKRQSILLATVIMCATFVLVSISWAAFSSTLTVGGTGNVSAQSWDIDFTNTVNTKWTAAQKLTGTSTSLAELPASTDTDAFGIPEDGKAKGFLGTLKMSGDKITYTWYVQNFGTLDATYSINGVIATSTYTSGSNVDITCNTSDNSTDKTFCNNYVKTMVTVDGDVTTPSSTYSLGKAGSSTDHATIVLTIEITGTDQIYTGTVAAHYGNNARATLLSNIQKLSGSSGDLNISVKGLTLTEKQDVSISTTTREETTTTTTNPCLKLINQSTTYDYTGSEETFTAECPGTYKLEVWGAQGGSYNSYNGGYGGYSVGEVKLNSNEKIYINVGGQGQALSNTCPVSGGYNGGGAGRSCENVNGNGYIDPIGTSGGGATHIALSSGLLSTFENKQTDLLVVAGGGGGADYSYFSADNYYFAYGGNAGGYIGNSTTSGTTSAKASGGYNGYNFIPVPGGTQSYVSSVQGGEYNYRESAVAGTFGQGATMTAYATAAGGGGGYYGGAAGKNWAGGGGSGYIGNSSLTNKAMYCYNCTESSETATKTISTTNVSETATSNYAKTGNGYAKITYVSYSN